MSATKAERRSLRYIRLAAYLAGRPSEVKELSLTLTEIESLLEASLPEIARFPSWWRNDPNRMHSRAWLTAGWEVEELDGERARVIWRRSATTDIQM